MTCHPQPLLHPAEGGMVAKSLPAAPSLTGYHCPVPGHPPARASSGCVTSAVMPLLSMMLTLAQQGQSAAHCSSLDLFAPHHGRVTSFLGGTGAVVSFTFSVCCEAPSFKTLLCSRGAAHQMLLWPHACHMCHFQLGRTCGLGMRRPCQLNTWDD